MALLLASCSRPSWQHDSGLVFGTVYNIAYEYGESLQGDIDEALLQVDQEFSLFNAASTVARINRGDSTVERSPMFLEVCQLAQTVSQATGGAFDITVAPLVNAWGFGFKHEQTPTPAQVDSLLQIRTQMDFAAIAKGYGCDVVSRLLDGRGVANYMVEIGGEVVVRGHNPNGDLWHIGINKPMDESPSPFGGELQEVLSLTDIAMATSGNYRNYYYKDGRKNAHTIDPRSGYPVQHDLLSATVLAADCATADAFATSFMVLGLDSARAVLDSHPTLMAYLIYAAPDGSQQVWHSPTLTQCIDH